MIGAVASCTPRLMPRLRNTSSVRSPFSGARLAATGDLGIVGWNDHVDIIVRAGAGAAQQISEDALAVRPGEARQSQTRVPTVTPASSFFTLSKRKGLPHLSGSCNG
jgi:hypothetical protein